MGVNTPSRKLSVLRPSGWNELDSLMSWRKSRKAGVAGVSPASGRVGG